MDEVLTPHSDLTQEEGLPTDNADLCIVTLPVLPPIIWIFVFITSDLPRVDESNGRHGAEERGEAME